MIVLDTNVVCEFDKPRPSVAVEAWLARQDPMRVYVTAPTVMEQAYGAERVFLKTGSSRYHDTLDRLIHVTFQGRILEFVDPAPTVAGKVRAKRASVGRPVSVQDSMFAAICLVHGATLATRNVRGFDGIDLKLVNPFEPVA